MVTVASEIPITNILTLAKKLIAIPSVTGDTEKAVDALTIIKKELPEFTPTSFVSNGVPSLLYSNKANSKHFKLILNAHLDIVAGVPEQFQPYEQDGKLYGRGAYDMKTAAAVMVLLYKALATKVPYPLGLQLVAEEEFTTGNGTEYQLKQGIGADFAIIGESGSNLAIINETKGIITLTITTTGNASHGAYPWKGKNAIVAMNEVLRTLLTHFPQPKEATDQTTVTITQIATTNTTWNMTPNNCSVILDIRFNKDDKDTIIPHIKSLLPKDVTYEILQLRNHHFADPHSKYIQHLQATGELVNGQRLSLGKTYGGSDTTAFSDAGYEAVQFGPVGFGQHNDIEWVDIKSLEDYYKILKTYITSLN